MNILGIPIDTLTRTEILARAEHFLEEPRFHRIATVNPEFLLRAENDEMFRQALLDADLRIADGFGIVLAGWLRGQRIRRFPGSDLMEEILRIAESKDIGVYLAINKNGLSSFEEIKWVLQKKYPLLKINGADIDPDIRHSSFPIHDSIALCNFGIPEQETFLNNLDDRSGIRLAMGVGGSFDYLTGRQKRAPKWLRTIGLEWFWRLVLQPKRWKRIWNAVIVFPFRMIFAIITGIHPMLPALARKRKLTFVSLASFGNKQVTAFTMTMSDTSAIRVRFAPSPTGYLHVGGLRTALYNHLFAKKNGGTFILRIEDTDQKRFVQGAIESLLASLYETGLVPDEGVFLKKNQESGIRNQEKEIKESNNYPDVIEIGGFGPYIQSERLDIYKKYADKLVASGKAYHCFCSAERLTELREEQAKNKQAPKYDKHCLSLAPDEVTKKLAAGEPYVIRLDVSAERGDVVFDDLIRGQVKINARDIDDQVLTKSDGFPTYHLANVVDDHLMSITHVIRGEEWLPSTPKHILLYEAFGWELPQFAHIPLLLNPDKSKLSKRQGDVAVEDYLKKGYLKEALINFVALLGWNPGAGSTQEIFFQSELISAFDLSGVHKSGAVFDLKKLDWMNAEYIKKLPIDGLYERIRSGNFLEKDLISKAPEEMRTEEYLKRVIVIEQDRLAKLSDVGENNTFFFASEISYDAALLNWKQNTPDMTKEALEKAQTILANLNDADFAQKEVLEKVLMDAAGEKRGDFLWPLRVALTGAERSPSPFDCAWVLGKSESLKRIEHALSSLA